MPKRNVRKSKEAPVIFSSGAALKDLKISRRTLYSFADKGLIPDRRNPKNNYRIFWQKDLEKIREFLNGITR